MECREIFLPVSENVKLFLGITAIKPVFLIADQLFAYFPQAPCSKLIMSTYVELNLYINTAAL